MHPEKLRMLKEIMATEFTAIELQLYLDTHPKDRRALEDYNGYVRKLWRLIDLYQERYGPLMQFETGEYPWRYIEEPWPWEITY